MNLSSARGVANLKVPYPLTPFSQQGSARVCSSRAFPANSCTPVWSVFTIHRGCPLGGGEGGLTMTLLSTTIHRHNWYCFQLWCLDGRAVERAGNRKIYPAISQTLQSSFYHAFPRLLSLYWGENMHTHYGTKSR